MATLEELMAMGGKPAETAAPPTGKTLEELLAAGGKAAPPHETNVTTSAAAEPSLKDRLISMARGGVNAAGTLAGNALDTASLGYYRKARDFVGSKIAPEATAGNQAAEGQFNQAHPFVANMARAAGNFIPGGAPARIGEAMLAGVRGLTAAAPSILRGTLAARPVAGALTGAATGAVTTAAEDVAQGQDAGTTLRDIGRSAVVGGAVGGGAGVVGAAAAKVNNSRGAQARRFIEEHGQGATVGPLSPGRGGVFENELAGLPANDKGIGAAAKIGAKNILQQVAEEHRVETSRPFREMKALIDNTPAANRPRDITSIVTNMQSAAYDLETAPFARAQLEGQLNILERYRDPKTGIVMVPERQINGLRRTLMRTAKVGTNDAPGEAEAPLRKAAFEAKQLVDQGPYAALNDFYSEGMKKLEGTRKQLGLKARPAKDAEVDVRKTKLTLARQGQNTATAGGDADLEALKRDRPELAAAANLSELQRAKADLSYHLIPQHGGLMPRVAGAALGPGAALGAAALGHGGAGLAAAGGMMALQNATPIAGRVLYPLTRNMGTSTPGRFAGRLANPLARAAEEKRRREREAANTLSGGMQ
jgi:hypothetical protein